MKKSFISFACALSLTVSACGSTSSSSTIQTSEAPKEVVNIEAESVSDVNISKTDPVTQEIVVAKDSSEEILPDGVIYSKDEWFAKGYLDIPFNYADMKYLEIKDNAQMSPKTIEEASTVELLHIIEELSPSPEMYDKAIYYYDEINRSFNCFSALCMRDDLSHIALVQYEEYGVFPVYSASANMAESKYDHLAIREDVKRRLLELILAMNSSYVALNEEEKQLTLQMMCDYAQQRQEGKCYNVANVISSMFFAYIAESVNDGNGSLWSDYILALGEDAPAYQYYQEAIDHKQGWVIFDYE